MTLALVLLACGLVFFDFLFGNRLFIFPRVGSDTYYQYWPYGQHVGELLRSGHLPWWSFGPGLGNQMDLPRLLLNPYLALVDLLPSRWHPSALALKAVLECVGAALAWRLYLQALNIRGTALVLFPLLFAFNGYLTLWGQHDEFGLVFTLVPLALYTFELMLIRGKHWPLVLSLAYFMAANLYFFWMFSLFLAPFAVLRYLTVFPFRWRPTLAWFGRLAACFAAAALLSAWIVVPMVLQLLNSPRVDPGLQVGITALFSLPVYVSGALRLFSNNVLGSDIWFRGPMNYYELPQLYAGLLPLLLAPQVFRMAGRRETIGLAIGSALILASLLSPFVCLMFNGFAAVSHRHSFLAIVFVLYLAARAFQELSGGAALSRRLLVATYVVLSLPFAGVMAANLLVRLDLLPHRLDEIALAAMRDALPLATLDDMQRTVREEILPVLTRELFKVFLLLTAYTAVLCMDSVAKRQSLLRLLVLLAVTEAVMLTWPTHNRRITLDKGYPAARQGYYDDSFDASRELKQRDPSLYRVHKTYESVFLNDGLIQGYYGTSSYLPLQPPSVLAFYEGMNIPLFRFSPSYAPGFGSRPMLNTLVGVKYVMSRSPLSWPGYTLVGTNGGVRVYENDERLPIGFSYRYALDPREFRRLPDILRQFALLQGLVPGSDAGASKGGPAGYPVLTMDDRARLETEELLAPGSVARSAATDADLRVTGPAAVTVIPRGDDPRLLVPVRTPQVGVSVSFDVVSEVSAPFHLSLGGGASAPAAPSGEKLDVYRGRGRYEVCLFPGAASTGLCIRFPGQGGAYELENLSVRRFPFALYKEAIAARRRGALEITRFEQDRLMGSVTADGPEMLFLSIPYAPGWSARRNGRPVAVQQINLGFIGVPLERGPNTVELRFVPPGLRWGCVVSLAAALLAGGMCIVRRAR